MDRFAWGFIMGGLFGFIGWLFPSGPVGEALIAGFFIGLFVGGCGALFGKRVLDFLIAFLIP
jgi:hypothetical protein